MSTISGELEITAIDIGQGDAFLVVTPGGHTLLLDSGGLLGMSHSDMDIGEDVVSPYLWQRGVWHIWTRSPSATATRTTSAG